MHYLDSSGPKKSKGNLSNSFLHTDEDSKPDLKLPQINSKNFDDETEKYLQDLKSGQNNILVAVRSRPLNSREMGISNYETVRILDEKVVVLLDPQNLFDANDVFRNNRNKEQQYAFDFAFDQMADTTRVFERTTKIMIPGVLQGLNATIFAYGATGAGKTYTMLGSASSPGIMSLTMNELFNEMQIQSENKEFVAKISYLEVYNETLRDLLSSEDTPLELREDTARGVIVAGINEVVAKTSQEVMTMLKIGSKNRTMEPTGANIVSSRSHAVLQVTVEHKDKNQGITEEITISKLSLIDLAGSERASNTNNRGQRLIEGANINRSLLALGNCITLLSDKNEKGKQNIHIPYRDSKLTRLLKDSLGGNCRTVMIANISPSVICFEDTYNTLKYANRAKNIKTSVTRNILSVENHMEKYTQIISELKNENDHLKRLLHNNQNGLSEFSVIRDPMFSINDGLMNDMKHHFEEEMKMKKKIFDLELQIDDIEDRLLIMKYETNITEDKVAGDRFEEYQNIKKKLIQQIEELKRDYGYLTGKRAQLNARIQNEKNKDSITFLNSIFKQNQMTIQMVKENMELQHKEKRVENQVKWKDRQIKYLQEQLGMKEVKVKETQHLRAISNTPVRLNKLNQKDSLNISRDSPAQRDPEESLSFLQDLTDQESSPQPLNLKAIGQAKQPLFLPNVRYKVSKSSLPSSSKKTTIIPPVRRVGSDSTGDNTRHSSVKSLPASYAQPRYYYKKQEFMLQKNKPFEGSHGDESKPKKRYGYLALQDKIQREAAGTNTSVRDPGLESGENSRSRRLSFDKGIRRKSVRNVADSSHISTAPTSKNVEKKKNLLDELNSKKEIMNLPLLSKIRQKHQFNNIGINEENSYAPKIKG